VIWKSQYSIHSIAGFAIAFASARSDSALYLMPTKLLCAHTEKNTTTESTDVQI